MGRRPTFAAAVPWVGLLVLGCLAEGVAINQLLSGGECSTTGYTRFGPAPVCDDHTGWWVALLCVGLPLAIASGASERSPLEAWHFFLGVFGSIGVGALLSDVDMPFRLIFGAGFVGFGAGMGYLVWRVRRRELSG